MNQRPRKPIYIVCHRYADAVAYARENNLGSNWIFADATTGYRIQLASKHRPYVVLFETDVWSTTLVRFLKQHRAIILIQSVPSTIAMLQKVQTHVVH